MPRLASVALDRCLLSGRSPIDGRKTSHRPFSRSWRGGHWTNRRDCRRRLPLRSRILHGRRTNRSAIHDPPRPARVVAVFGRCADPAQARLHFRMVAAVAGPSVVAARASRPTAGARRGAPTEARRRTTRLAAQRHVIDLAVPRAPSASHTPELAERLAANARHDRRRQNPSGPSHLSHSWYFGVLGVSYDYLRTAGQPPSTQ